MSWYKPLLKNQKEKSPNKYGAKKTALDGHSFASKGEAHCYQMLKNMADNGEIAPEIQVQDNIYLTEAKILYMADFRIFDYGLNGFCWVEFKGMETDTWRIKRRLWKCYGPGPLRIYKQKSASLFLCEEIEPKRHLVSAL